MSTTTTATKNEEHMADLYFTASKAISTTSITDEDEATENNQFDCLPSEIIEVIGSFLRDPKDTVSFCQTCRRVRAISMDKLRLYDPRIKISSSDIDYLLRKWKIPKFELTKETTDKQLEDKEIEGFYFDPYELWKWFINRKYSDIHYVYQSKSIFRRVFKAKGIRSENSVMEFAACYGDIFILELLLADERVDPSAEDNYAIKMASCNGHLEIVKLLLEDERVDPSVDDNYPIRQASSSGRSKVVRLLLQDGRVDPSAKDNYAIRRLISMPIKMTYGVLEVVKLLLAHPKLRLEDKDILMIRKSTWADNEMKELLLNYESRQSKQRKMEVNAQETNQ